MTLLTLFHGVEQAEDHTDKVMTPIIHKKIYLNL